MIAPAASEIACAIRILMTLGRHFQDIPGLADMDILNTDYGRDLIQCIRLEQIAYRRERETDKRMARKRREGQKGNPEP